MGNIARLAGGVGAFAVFAAGLSLAACGGGTTGDAPSSDASSPSDASSSSDASSDATTAGDSYGPILDAGSPPFDVNFNDQVCAVPLSDTPPYDSPAAGSVMGSGLSATLCPGGASVRLESTAAGTQPYLFALDYTIQVGNEAPVTDFLFQTPSNASNGELDVVLGISAAAPGEYTSPAGQQCGSMAFTYYLPVPPGIDCDAGAPPNCPAGCGTVCSGFGCEPCSPQPPAVSYTAQGSADCLGDTTIPIGSWDLVLTSVTPTDAGSGGLRFYTSHGTFTATMVGGEGGADTATFSVSF
jgi:hypothetical protein